MKKTNVFIVLLFAVSLMFSFSSAALAKTSVKGYTKKSGTYVAPHYRTTPNYKFNDNWSTKGNYNPYTGKSGTKTYKYKPYKYRP